MRVLELPKGASPTEWGRVHGESYRGEIRSLADIRLYLAMKIGRFDNEAQLLDIARAHVPVLERYDPALHAEFMGIAEGANLDPARVVVVNHYTDLRDIVGNSWPETPIADAVGGDEGCSVLWANTPEGPIVAQTWDMHATAIPYILMLRVPETERHPASWTFSITGCLGMAGMNRDGVTVAINNLNSDDARIGVMWPALVRRALRCRAASGARDVFMTAPIGSGHHYLVADARSAYGIETSGTRRELIFTSEDEPAAAARYLHTNHCLNPRIDEVSHVSSTSTTHERLTWLQHSVEARAIEDVHDAWRRLGSDDGYPRSVCTNMATPQNPHGTATCGAIAMEPRAARVWAEAGLIHNVAPTRFEFSTARARE